MALAIVCKRVIDTGVVADAGELARVAGVTRARMTQVLNRTLLAPDLQERLLMLMIGTADQHATNMTNMTKAVVQRATGHPSWKAQRSLLT